MNADYLWGLGLGLLLGASIGFHVALVCVRREDRKEREQ